MITPEYLHYFSAALMVVLGGMGGSIGHGLAGAQTLSSMLRQPTGNDYSFRAMVVGLSLIESGCIVALVVSLVVLLSGTKDLTMARALAEFGMAVAVGVAAVASSIASSFVVKAAMTAISRQPVFAPKMFTMMLITQSIIEAPVIFAFVTALTIRARFSPDMSLIFGLQCLAAGLIIAFGCIGPSIGQAIFAGAANGSLGLNTDAYAKIFTFTLLGEAVIETPMIFCLVFSFVMMYTQVPIPPDGSLLIIAPFFIATGTVSVAALAASSAIGYVGSRSCYQIAQTPEHSGIFLRTTLLAIAFIESTVIYALIVGFLLLFKVGSV